jgi:hypothetical protein
VDDEARPDQPAEAEHHGEQPNDARDAGLVGEHDFEAREIDLGLRAGRRLKPYLEGFDRLRPDLAHRALHRRIPADVPPFPQLAP